MLKVAIIGLGGMGRGHLNVYMRLMSEGYPLEVVAVCDINEKVFERLDIETNLDEFKDVKVDFSKLHKYTNVDDLLANEELDVVSIATPTFEHSSVAIKCLKAGVNVLSEKPMGINPTVCQLMIDTAKKNNVRLMIGQCLRFQGNYCYVKECIEKGTHGKLLGAYMWRGGVRPATQWFFNREKGGGASFDQHIHDTDMVNWLFGLPKAVQSVGVNFIEGSGIDAISTNYIYDDNVMVNTHNRWIDFGTGFKAGYRFTFEKATIISEKGDMKVYRDGQDITPEYDRTSAYYNEIKAFCDAVKDDTPIPEKNTPEQSLNTIRLALAEIESCEKNGAIVTL